VKLRELFKEIGVEPAEYDDLHISRMFSAFVVISNGKVIQVTEPSMRHCPLARFFYPDFYDTTLDRAQVKKHIAKAMEEKIQRFGLFTEHRELVRKRIEVPYGASEILMYAMEKGIIDAVVVVCDGAGTVVVERPEVVQGIGARMNGLFYTSPIPAVIERLEALNSRVVFRDARINQIEGVKEAVRLGYRSIAVTVNSYMDERVEELRAIEQVQRVRVYSMMVCATGVTEERLLEIQRDADVVWSCGSPELRKIIGKKAILQITSKIPVFVLTPKGLEIIAGYSSNEDLLRSLGPKHQYLIAGNRRGTKIVMGTFQTYLTEAELPVRDADEPRFHDTDR